MEFTNRRLMWHGMFLFLIGLLTGFAEQHFAIVGQRDAPRRAPEQWAFGLELETLDLLAYRRLRLIKPFGSTTETAAIGHGNEGA